MEGETFYYPTPLTERQTLDDDDDNDDSDGDRESKLSSYDTPDDEEYCASESGLDDRQEIVISTNQGQRQRENFKCAGCDNPNKVERHYGVNLCISCINLIYRIARREYRAGCVGGQGICRTTWIAGRPMKCQSCRVKRLMRLEIHCPAWNRFITALKIKSETFDNLTQPYQSQRQCERFTCVGCDRPDNSNVKFSGLNLCSGCGQFIRRLTKTKRKFHLRCISGNDTCRTTYIAGKPLECQSCRLKRLMKLNIRYPAWVCFIAELENIRKTHGYQTSRAEELEPGAYNEARESILSGDDNSSDGSYCSAKSSLNYMREIVPTSGQIVREQLNCAGCGKPDSIRKEYGLHLCSGCRSFISRATTGYVGFSCISGNDKCRTTYVAGKQIKCKSCRAKNLMKLNIRCLEWARFMAKHRNISETHSDRTSRDDESESESEPEPDDDDDTESVASSHSISSIDESDEFEDEAAVRITFKSPIGPGEDCDTSDDFQVFKIVCN